MTNDTDITGRLKASLRAETQAFYGRLHRIQAIFEGLLEEEKAIPPHQKHGAAMRELHQKIEVHIHEYRAVEAEAQRIMDRWDHVSAANRAQRAAATIPRSVRV